MTSRIRTRRAWGIAVAVTQAVAVLTACHAAPPSTNASSTASTPSASAAAAVSREQRCLEAARVCGAAFFSHDYERLLDCMPTEAFGAFPDAGGRAEARAEIERGMQKMARDGFSFESADYELPHDFATAGGRLFAIVPNRLKMKVPDGHLLQDGYMIGVSTDGGQSWRFISGTVGKETLLRIFPDFPATLALPEIPKPVLVP
jgi:hypothetical protein